jgi:eukaryotic-like serine/threonine-protein kinase
MRHAIGDCLDQFEILDVLGQGAYAETYLARNTATDERVVIKSPDPMLFADPAIFQRYKRESEIARSIEHPGVQRALDGGEHRAEPYLVLEYVEGRNLRAVMRELIERKGEIPFEVVTDWGIQLASALAYLHEHGIVHRDLKPENILCNADGRLKVADFGTALLDGAKRLTWKHLTDGIGTPDYMSPEQIQGERGDERSDIYAWGVLMYEFTTGTVPFRGDNWMATMAGHLTKSPEPSFQRRRDTPRALDAVIRKAMRRYPEHRYQHITEANADLEHLDQLVVASFDLSPEPPMGGLAAADHNRGMLMLIGGVAGGFIALVALIIVVSVLL